MRKRKQDFLLTSANRNILYYQKMVQRSGNSEQKEYYTNLLNREILWKDYLLDEARSKSGPESFMKDTVSDAEIAETQRTFTPEESPET